MTTAAELSGEYTEAAVAFQIALTQIGVATLAEALRLWQRVNPSNIAATADAWLADAIQMILSRRGQSRELALAYYRLARALQTGTTIPDPRQPEPSYVTLDQLRAEFAKLTDGLVDRDQVREEVGGSAGEQGEPESDEDQIEVDPDRIEIEPIEDLAELEDALDADALDEAEVVLEALGPSSLRKKLKRLDPRTAGRTEEERQALMEKSRKAREEYYNTAAKRTAAAAERIVMNGARGYTFEVARRDKRVIGWARRSRTGTPCAWCAMLISRGLILYSSKAAAEGRTADSASVQRGDAEEGDQYHNNCRCVAEPVYSRSYYLRSELFAKNREYSALWPKVTRGKSGKNALNAWRRYFRRLNKELERSAQAASHDTNAQEA